jgi:hypothetical protein
MSVFGIEKSQILLEGGFFVQVLYICTLLFIDSGKLCLIIKLGFYLLFSMFKFISPCSDYDTWSYYAGGKDIISFFELCQLFFLSVAGGLVIVGMDRIIMSFSGNRNHLFIRIWFSIG